VDENNKFTKLDLKTNKSVDGNGATVLKTSNVSMTYFDKKGYAFEESFSLKNNSDRDINEVSIRLIYKLENGEIIDYRDLNLKDRIPPGLSRKFTIRSFYQGYNFAYRYGFDDNNSYYTLFTVEYQILGLR
jgi:hypothetical protein